jgi:hypothetical protein
MTKGMFNILGKICKDWETPILVFFSGKAVKNIEKTVVWQLSLKLMRQTFLGIYGFTAEMFIYSTEKRSSYFSSRRYTT